MKTTFKRIIAAVLVAFMLFGSAPGEAFTGIASLFSIEAEAAEAQWLWPIKGAHYLTDGRWFDGTIYNGGMKHNGIDIPGYGLNVRASKSGTVYRVFKGCENWANAYKLSCKSRGICSPNTDKYYEKNVYCNNGFGRGVIIDHGDGTFSEYAHMSAVYVSEGQYIKQGDTIGTTGAYGFATGAHLHFQLARGNWYSWFNNTPTNFGNYPGASINYILDTEPPKPAAPSISADKTGNIPLNSKITYKWNAVSNATGYKVYLDGELIENIGNKTSYVMDAVYHGTYNFSVKAYNSKYESNFSNTVTSKTRVPSKVTFVDWDGTVIDNPRYVEYGSNAIAPDIPEREGYTFAGWDKSLNKITEDTIITATYKINKYKIKFLDYEGNVVSTQTVEYMKDAVAPSSPATPTGYEFFGWDSEKYLSVKEDATIRGIYAWGNDELPIVAEITTAKRQEDGYYVYFDLTNYPNSTTRGRAIVSLKTAEGKLVDTTESAAFSIPASGEKTGMEVFIPCEYSASTVELIIVDSFSSGVPISKSVSIEVDQALEWSDWSDVAPTESEYSELETKTQYRYRDKEFYSVTNTSSFYRLSNWNYLNTTSKKSYGNWNTTYSPVSANSSTNPAVEVLTEQEKVSDAYTKYNLYYYRYWNANYNKYYYTYSSSMGGTYYSISVNSNDVKYWGSSGGYSGYVKNSGYYKFSGEVWWLGSSETVPATYRTKYTWRNVTTNYTHNFYQWEEWSDWTDSLVESTDNRQVETRTLYRYRNEFGDAGIEDNSGSLINVDYTVDSSLGGKQATVFVHKYNEASDWTCEYVKQFEIPADGDISFSFKPREELSALTGDYTVSLGIEGNTNTIIIKIIEAPKPEYTVTFRDWDGTIIDTQTVEQGKTAAYPENIPEREGYDFVGWSSTLTNINADVEIEARYVIKTYDVIFVDWTAKSILTKTFEHGEFLSPPEATTVEGYNFVGWSGVTEGETVVTEDMIVTADYDAEIYEVNIYDFDMNVIGTQTVEHGSFVDLPDEIEKSKYIFLGWKSANDNSTVSAVTGDMDVYPVYIFTETTESPTASLDSGVYKENQTLELSCPTESSVIHYTTDGTNPLDSLTAKLYEEPIVLDRSMEIKFAASTFEMNDSDVVTEVYAINNGEGTSDWMQLNDVPDYVLGNMADYSVQQDTGYRYKDVIVTSSTSEIAALEASEWSNEGFEYGNQSEWVLEKPVLEDVEYEIIEQKPPQVEETHYQYTHYKYYDDASGKYIFSATEVDGAEGEWETYTSPVRLTVSGFVSGTTTAYYLYNGEEWYNQKPVTVMVDPGYMMYSYKVKNYTLTKWTAWTVEAPAADEAREIQTDTVYCYTAPDMCLVEIVSDFYSSTYLGIVGKSLDIDTTLFTMEGFTFDGFYKDAEFTEKWDVENDVLTGNVKLYAKNSLKSYTVNFCDNKGNVLDTQTVEHGSAATAPDVKIEDGYVLIGWDTDEYLRVERDVTVTAVIKAESEITKVKLNRSKFTTTVGSAFYLNATVTPNNLEDKTVTWSSSDYSVADVNDEGVVLAVSSGIATITATAFDGTTACCIVTVTGSADSELSLSLSTSLTVDDSGYLRNIPIITDEILDTHIAATAGEIKAQFINTDIAFVDINGNAVSDNTPIGTGSRVILMDGESVIDSITLVVTGDYNGDGYINNRDASMITRYLVDKEKAELYQMLAIDVNGDGYVNNRDASMVSRYLVGKEKL
ncbi:MAG: InlB B-repeat-containing protein [Clostridia bacterium]|nr:InlB B-repeat-containing protein [Clostridia bacterium]